MKQPTHTPTTVSVVIPHYGSPEPTLNLVAMLGSQDDISDLEIVVVDDASPEPFPHIDGLTLVRRDTNGGFGSAVNSGAAIATGEFLLILNSDLDIGPTFIADLLDAARPWLPAVVGPVVLDHAGNHTWTGRRFPTTDQHVVEWLAPLARFRHTTAWHVGVGHDVRCTPGNTASPDWLVGACLLLPSAAFHAVGGFDEAFYMNSEEIDLQRRLRDRGLPSIFLGAVSVIHEGGGSSDPHRRRQWLIDSRMTYAAKWGGRRRLKAALGAATAVNLAVNCIRRLYNRDVTPMRAARHELALLSGPRP